MLISNNTLSTNRTVINRAQAQPTNLNAREHFGSPLSFAHARVQLQEH
jgi:hypothetical protein